MSEEQPVGKTVEESSEMELKAAAFDIISGIEMLQSRLGAVRNELARRGIKEQGAQAASNGAQEQETVT